MRGAWCSAATWLGGLLLAGSATAQRADCDAAEPWRVLRPSAPVDAQAHWLDRRRLRWPGTSVAVAPGDRFRLHHARHGGLVVEAGAAVRGGDRPVPLVPSVEPLPAALAERFRFVAPGVDLALPATAQARLPELLRGELLLVHEDARGRVKRATALQVAGALDDRYAAAGSVRDLGAMPRAGGTAFALWAPTARRVSVCLHDTPDGPSRRWLPLRRDEATGVWRGTDAGQRPTTTRRTVPTGPAYTYLVDVFVRGTGWVRQRVTDPYSLALTADSHRSVAVDLEAPALQPEGWTATRAPASVAAPTDLVVYELHVRDFSWHDASVGPRHRGRYGAFTEPGTDGMRHLAALARAGVTDLHLLPVFDIASIPERDCATPTVPPGPPDGTAQQAAVAATRAVDCFNWGYDPLHYTVPEGSYATEAADPAARIREFRAMVVALHRTGLRVGMDVVYNHTPASGQHRHSVLDRIVPGYYHRLDASGRVERSSCCDNTATEHRMMGKLMLDSVLAWARHYRIDSFRFDLMGHQPRALMVELKRRLKAETGRDIPLIGEGWNFGEVADGARFVQASQLSLNGTGIASFSDRGRDALRGGGHADTGAALVDAKGWVHGPQADAAAQARQADGVRVGLAGTLRGYRMIDATGQLRPLEALRYGGQQPAGFASQPSEVVNYAENHDNHTLFDLNALRLPADTPGEDRARVQTLAAAVVAFSQGIAYFHAGQDMLRSKSGDRNSYDSGDHFNRLDWTATDNGYGAGLPPAEDNGRDWPLWRERLADVRLKPAPADIAWARDAFRDLLRIRASTPLFRLRSADDVTARLRFVNTGPTQVPTVVAGHLDGSGLPGAGFQALVYLVNADTVAQTVGDASLAGRPWQLHPVHRAADAADRRARQAQADTASGRFTVPPRTAVVFVVE
ncbi:alpha-1,6-glucosidase domain-containing protein [Ideonella sp. A 288]|uniref:alpha-1,6-glucosidase domain-containing protein n=1 Tax=Ideonella sp. A 288 TaxID=1962181 RepID=UPI000B4AAF98|nr:alpha-1,6-glucosidase domain-containing protein [Ideonella sp. A 288]